MIQFLFRKSHTAPSFAPSAEGPRVQKSSKEWTNKLASLVDDTVRNTSLTSTKQEDTENQVEKSPSRLHRTSLRLEGPYFTPADPARYDTVICLVAGTGITGAVAIAAAFSAQFSKSSLGQTVDKAPEKIGINNPSELDSTPRRWKRCVVVWSVRQSDYIKLPFFQDTPGLDVRTHLTGKGHERLDARRTINDISGTQSDERVWVYLSGPNPFIEAGEKACRASGVDFFGARWT